MKCRLVLIILLWFCYNAFSQKHFYDISNQVPLKYKFNADSIYNEKIKITDSGDLKQQYSMYCENNLYYHETMLNSGYIYFNWIEAEEYVNGLIKNICAVNKITEPIQAYIVRDQDVNAAANDFGMIYVNVGLLAEIHDEAALVSVLAHEVAHIVNSDGKKNFVFKKPKSKVIYEILNRSKKSRDYEYKADEFGYETCIKLGYNIASEYHIITKFESDYRWFTSQYNYQNPKWYISVESNDPKDKKINADSLEYTLMDHPDNEVRLKLLKQYTTKNPVGKKFIVDETKFLNIKHKAALEQLYLDFEEAEYKNCLRSAFYFHLQNQDNVDYLEYIVECCRKIITSNPDLKHKGFLTEESKEEIFDDGKKGILHGMNYISLDTVFLNSIKMDSIYGAKTKPFETYLKAYNFFLKKLKQKNPAKAQLINALYELSKNKRDKAIDDLKSYLQSVDSSIEKKSIEILLAGNIEDKLRGNPKNIIYIAPSQFYKKFNGDVEYSFIESQKGNEYLKKSILDKQIVYPNEKTEVVFSYNLPIKEFQFYNNLSDQLQFFKNEKEVGFENAANKSMVGNDYWQAIEVSDPLNPDLLKKRKSFFVFSPEYIKEITERNIKSLTIVTPYFYKHDLLGLMFYFEIKHYNLTDKKYLYFEQEYLQKFVPANIKNTWQEFTKKLIN